MSEPAADAPAAAAGPTSAAPRRGPQRAALAATAAIVALVGAAWLISRDRPRTVTTPAFSVQLEPGVREAEPRGNELLRLRDGRATMTVTPLELPSYEGDVAGTLPVYATNHSAATPVTEGRARINDAPGYELDYGDGADVFLVRGDTARTGVVIALRGRAVKALRSTLRSFEFRDD